MEATQSHNRLLQKLTRDGWEINVALHTYKSNFQDDLLRAYPSVLFAKFCEPVLEGSTREAVRRALNSVIENIYLSEYDWLLVLRFDLYLKDLFLESFNPRWSKITFMNPMHYLDDVRLPHISDPFIFIPRDWFFEKCDWKGVCVNTQHLLYHQSIGQLIKNGLKMTDIGFMSLNIYPTNSLQHSNPYFRLNSRPEGPPLSSKMINTTFNEETHEFEGEHWK